MKDALLPGVFLFASVTNKAMNAFIGLFVAREISRATRPRVLGRARGEVLDAQEWVMMLAMTIAIMPSATGTDHHQLGWAGAVRVAVF